MRRTPAVIAIASALALVGSARAATVTIDATVLGGSRTFDIRSLSGGTVDSIALGAGVGAGFVADVTDARYDRVGYQVTSTLSDLYLVSGSTFDCAKKIASSAFSLDFLTSPVSVSGVKALAAPVWDLAGTLTGTLATTLGVASGTVVTVSAVAGDAVDSTLAGTFDGLEDLLPVKVAEGEAGAYSTPAAHSACAPSAGGSATTRLLMSGSANGLDAMLAWVQDALVAAADSNTDGTVSGTELTGSGSVEEDVMAAAVRDALDAAGVSLTAYDALIAAGTIAASDVQAALSATLRDLVDVAGQTGTYLSLPRLTASIPVNATPGTYRGTMTVTLVDVP